MFASLFARAEASVDNAIGDLGSRVLITIPFIIAIGFAAASFSMYVNRAYGAEVGNLIVAAAFVVVGSIVALVVKLRKSPAPRLADSEPSASEEQLNSAQSIFDNEHLMGIVSSAAPILLPALLRTATKNWPLIFAVAAGFYVFSLSENGGELARGQSQPQSPQA